MDSNNQNRKKPRKQTHNYNWMGSYFVTICMKDKKHHFGEIVNSGMKLNEIGMIAQNCWLDISDHFENVEINENEFVVMPNHVHGIVHLLPDRRFDELTYKDTPYASVGKGTKHGINTERSRALVGKEYESNDAHHLVGKRHAFSLLQNDRKHSRLSNVIGSYKSSVTKLINQQFPNTNFYWQTSYYDHIILNKKQLQNIQDYIYNNPTSWDKDEYN